MKYELLTVEVWSVFIFFVLDSVLAIEQNWSLFERNTFIGFPIKYLVLTVKPLLSALFAHNNDTGVVSFESKFGLHTRQV